MFNIAVNSLFAFFFFEDQLRQQKKRLSTQRKTMLFRETLHTRFSIPIVAFPVSKKKKKEQKSVLRVVFLQQVAPFPPVFASQYKAVICYAPPLQITYLAVRERLFN
jgi:hypothetical protein